jgi:type I restriction enzyme M protein
MSYGDYVEQLTYLLFLKMDEEQQLMRPSSILENLRWASLLGRDGDDLEVHYRHILAELGKGQGLIPTIFRKAQNKIQDPAKLRRLVALIDGETWMGLDIDVKVRFTRVCWRKMPRTSSPAPGSTSHRAR